MATKRTFTVVELSKTWVNGVAVPEQPVDTLASRFEDVIAANQANGYDLIDWKLHTNQTAVTPAPGASGKGDAQNISMVETIVAIFRLRGN